MPTIQTVKTAIEGLLIERQSRVGEADGAVLHVLPGGVLNPEGFGLELKDVYAFTAKGRNVFRGGHYHPKLDELFAPMCGAALWILSDFREGSGTYGVTEAFILAIDEPAETKGYPVYALSQGSLPRLRVPHGIYHGIFPVTDDRMITIALGSTGYDKEDYKYPTPDEVPRMKEILRDWGVVLPTN